MASFPPVIAWDYQFAPNAQKSRNYLYAAGIPFKICEQPFFVPRPILRSIGITYRRVPVLSIGKDVFCDNSSFIDALQLLGEQKGRGLERHMFDRTFEAWGYRSFWIVLPCVPSDFVTDKLSQDRKDVFPLFSREDYSSLQENGASELRALMTTVEKEFLTSTEGPWIMGTKCGLADIHVMWVIKWALKTLDIEKQPGFERDKFPKLYRWIEMIPHHDEALEKSHKLSEEQAIEQLMASEYAIPDIGIDSQDPMQLKEGERVQVEATDAEPNTHPQHGILVGLSTDRIVLQLDNDLRVHFPRIGYIIKRAPSKGNGQT